MNPQDLSARYQPELDTELRLAVGDLSLPMYHMMRYHLGWVDASGQARMAGGGKMLRPAMCLLACEGVGGDWRTALPAAVALELLHNFTLIHDDIEDNDRNRRGMPTVWDVWGLAQGVNTGDAMHVLARLALLGLSGKGVLPEKMLRAARRLDETCLRVCEGQCRDIAFEERIDVRVEDYLEMTAGKTAALFSCSVELGAMLGTEDERTIDALARFGRYLGMAFQIQDDVLGIWGEDSRTGKPVAGDILKRKKTLPVLYGLDRASAEERDRLGALYSRDKIAASAVPEVLDVLDRTGARQYAGEMAGQYADRALAELDVADVSAAARGDFRALTEFILNREY